MKHMIWSTVVLLLLASCSGKPRTGEIENQVVAQLHAGGDASIFHIENFQKVNGFEGQDGTYIAEISYDVVFDKGFSDMTAAAGDSMQNNPLGSFLGGMQAFGYLVQFGNFTKGERRTMTDKVTLLKTDNGWRLSEDWIGN